MLIFFEFVNLEEEEETRVLFLFPALRRFCDRCVLFLFCCFEMRCFLFFPPDIAKFGNLAVLGFMGMMVLGDSCSSYFSFLVLIEMLSFVPFAVKETRNLTMKEF